MSYQILSASLFVAHSLGFIFLLFGIWKLLRGVKGEGQSAEGVAALRRALLKLFRPILGGALALLALLALTFYERSPLTNWLQVIAPLSTVIWVIWGHFSARKIDPGELFEALVPLAPQARGSSIAPPLMESAQAWSNQGHSLSAQALAQTALRAVDDARAHHEQSEALSLDDLLIVMRDALADTQAACREFPLGQQLTLADWLFEGERLAEIWRRGLGWIDRGRALINPLTLLDNKSLWGWSRGKPGPLFERELSAWLHYGLYLLVVQRLQERQSARESTGGEGAERRSRVHRESEEANDAPAPPLWGLLTRKMTVPFWLYWVLGSVAVTANHPLIGGVLAAVSGVLLWLSLGYTTSLRRWRQSFSELGALRRASRSSNHELNHEVSSILREQTQRLHLDSESRPLSSLLRFAKETSFEVGMTYRRPEHPDPPIALLNATIVDALVTAELICDDLIQWRESSGTLSKVIWLLSKFGVSDDRVEEILLESARSWAQGSEIQESSAESSDLARGAEESSDISLTERAERADTWLMGEVAELNFLLRKPAELALSKLTDVLNDWLSEELTQRLIPLYQGAVGEAFTSSSAPLSLTEESVSTDDQDEMTHA